MKNTIIYFDENIPEKQAFHCLNELYISNQLLESNNCKWFLKKEQINI